MSYSYFGSARVLADESLTKQFYTIIQNLVMNTCPYLCGSHFGFTILFFINDKYLDVASMLN